MFDIFVSSFLSGTISSKWLKYLEGTIEHLDLSYNRFGGLFFNRMKCRLLGPTLRHLKISGNAFVGKSPNITGLVSDLQKNCTNDYFYCYFQTIPQVQ